ncbi:hypothetical protein HUK65_08375 [Rhodobacteraceae bacterium 2376]|uniref:Uncharacterized protein n=1 Tax=Rhabdonatronobacter sediminivivens TaxID=2743469 RepID=A0A7Z0HZ77_9RHOB|nr:hypothetical protein [Rhabdonatronobacter sediminivivens]NYS25008.1 hypothetical protein [Rhabdonatronobacter sediminivivens]
MARIRAIAQDLHQGQSEHCSFGGNPASFAIIAKTTGNDTLEGGTGDDLLFGGGHNTAVFSGNRADYLIDTDDDTGVTTVTDRSTCLVQYDSNRYEPCRANMRGITSRCAPMLIGLS